MAGALLVRQPFSCRCLPKIKFSIIGEKTLDVSTSRGFSLTNKAPAIVAKRSTQKYDVRPGDGVLGDRPEMGGGGAARLGRDRYEPLPDRPNP